jgi:hypothetical protein
MEHDYMIKALTPNGTNHSLYIPEFQVKNIHYISFVPSEALG